MAEVYLHYCRRTAKREIINIGRMDGTADRIVETDENGRRFRKGCGLLSCEGRFSYIVLRIAMESAFDEGGTTFVLITDIVLVINQYIVQYFLGGNAEREQ